MDFELKSTPGEAAKGKRTRASEGAEFALGATPQTADQGEQEAGGLPRGNGAPILCLMARDPRTLFAYWDIDWSTAFGDSHPADKKVHLRITQADGLMQSKEVEPMAGSCYIEVEAADSIYSGELGYYQPAATWRTLATSEIISTPPTDVSEMGEDNLATIPFHLSFQRMIDALRSSRQDDAPLLTQLAEARERVRESAPDVTPDEREIVHAIMETESAMPAANAPQPKINEVWRRERLERILGFGATSPREGFGGSSRPL